MSSCIRAILKEPKVIELETVDIPEMVKPNEVLVEVKSVNLSDSDVSFYSNGYCKEEVLSEPLVMGHQASGVILKVGSEVRDFSRGDRIVMEPFLRCSGCDICKKNSSTKNSSFCTNYKRFGFPHPNGLGGFLQQNVVVPEDACHLISDKIKVDLGTLATPTALALNALNQSCSPDVKFIVIFGAGQTGCILTLLARKLHPDASICICDASESRVAFAKDLGAHYGIHIESSSSVEERVNKINETCHESLPTKGKRVAIFNCCENESVIPVGLAILKKKGAICTLNKIQISNENRKTASKNNIKIIEVCDYLNHFKESLAHLESLSSKLEKLITHRFNLDDSKRAFKLASSNDADSLAVIIRCNLEEY